MSRHYVVRIIYFKSPDIASTDSTSLDFVRQIEDPSNRRSLRNPYCTPKIVHRKATRGGDRLAALASRWSGASRKFVTFMVRVRLSVCTIATPSSSSRLVGRYIRGVSSALGRSEPRARRIRESRERERVYYIRVHTTRERVRAVSACVFTRVRIICVCVHSVCVCVYMRCTDTYSRKKRRDGRDMPIAASVVVSTNC